MGNKALGLAVVAFAYTAIAWQCSPRIDIAAGEAGEGGKAGEAASSASGSGFGGSSASTSAGESGKPANVGGGQSSGGSAGLSAGQGHDAGTTSEPGTAGESAGGSGEGGGTGSGPVCTAGADQTCNDNPAASSIWGHCEADGTCTCNPAYVINPETGRCTPRSLLAAACALPPEPGNCLDVGVPHFYFDSVSGACKEFVVYCGGTPHNSNAFKTLADCESACITPACEVPFVDGGCDGSFNVFSYDPSTGTCEPRVYGGCGGTTNRFASEVDCESACTWSDESSASVTIRGESCTGFGSLVTGPGDESSFDLEGSVLKRTLSWGCGCATRPEFVMMYSPKSPVELRLCHDDSADPCEAGCSMELTWDLAAAFEAAGTSEFVFAE